MNSRFLISHSFKPIGWVLFIAGLVLGIILLVNDFDYPSIEVQVFPLIGEDSPFSNPPFQWHFNNISDELASILIIVGGIIVSFSKTKNEDEYIAKIRSESLIWATYVNYFVLILAIMFVFDMSFFHVLIYNMFTVLLFFIVRFHYILYKTSKEMEND